MNFVTFIDTLKKRGKEGVRMGRLEDLQKRQQRLLEQQHKVAKEMKAIENVQREKNRKKATQSKIIIGSIFYKHWQSLEAKDQKKFIVGMSAEEVKILKEHISFLESIK
ncbi:MAG: hypothetical protein ACRDCN_14680 [Tannerellaceae bacterium]|uniref:hypothetical protein n=1 Tax=Serratia sp. (in: enterobacteria) TaxID=616 RepID=UPI003EE6FABE